MPKTRRGARSRRARALHVLAFILHSRGDTECQMHDTIRSRCTVFCLHQCALYETRTKAFHQRVESN